MTVMSGSLPWVTVPGPVTLVMAMSVRLATMSITSLAESFAVLSSAASCVAVNVWSPTDAPLVFQLKVKVFGSWLRRPPRIVRVPIVCESVVSSRVTVISPATS